MPNYDYRCSECQHTWEQQLTIANRDVPVGEPCPSCGKTGTIEKYLPSTGGLCYSVERVKTPDTFKDLLRNMKSKHRHSSINV